jgi:hypothetical protein
MFRKLARLGAVLALAGLTPACATITSGSTASLFVLTEASHYWRRLARLRRASC